jgi:hypothetical protein
MDADLRHATLTGTNLIDADLSHADLTDAYPMYANLHAADLGGATLTGANLRFADLTEADLTEADLTGADLTDATGLAIRFLTSVRWDLSTRWPKVIRESVQSRSAEIEPGLFQVRGDEGQDQERDSAPART